MLTFKILSCITILYCVLAIRKNVYHKNTQTHKFMKILALKTFKLYGMHICNYCYTF